MLSWRVAAKTDAGCQRQRNEDNFFVSLDEKLFVVADGMGNVVGGARASKVTVEAMEKRWQNNPNLSTDNDGSKLWLLDAIAAANFSLFTFHCRRGNVNLRGKLVPRYLGKDERIETIDHRAIEMGADDWIILCTDGLSIVLREQEISEILQVSVDAQTACEKLIAKSMDAGAPDNVTVIAIKYSGTDGGDKPPPAPVPRKPHPVQDDREISLALPPPDRDT